MANTIIKNKNSREEKKSRDDIAATNSLDQGEFKNLPICEIDFSPLNYRKFLSEQALNDFASELSEHGIICPLTVRSLPSGRYELVAGERRLRAAKIAMMEAVPVVVRSLTDEEVIEIQLAENLQREDPHPMHEAQAVGQMQRAGKTIDEIAARLGKSKQFVYSRLKLLSLIDNFQEMFLADVINIGQALEIATVSEASQKEIFEEHCAGWKDTEKFRLYNLDYYLNQFKYDLKQAPFNTKDKKLVPEAGACTNCLSNTATLKTLFPEFAKQAVCTNKDCYQKKCTVHFVAGLAIAIEKHNPSALLFQNRPTPLFESILLQIPGGDQLPVYNRYEVSMLYAPQSPNKDDYTNDGEEGDIEFGEEEFQQALDEYNDDLEAYNLQIESGRFQRGVLIDDECELVWFSHERTSLSASRASHRQVTAKEVETAIKGGTATPELLQAEIERISEKEKRSLELDGEKIQLSIHQQFSSMIDKANDNTGITDADLAAARLIIYQSLDYSARGAVNARLFFDSANNDTPCEEELYQFFLNMSDQQFSYLIRMAVLAKSDSKIPSSDTGCFLYKVAEKAGLDILAIEEQQNQKAAARQKRQAEKIKDLEKRISKMNQSQ